MILDFIINFGSYFLILPQSIFFVYPTLFRLLYLLKCNKRLLLTAKYPLMMAYFIFMMKMFLIASQVYKQPV
jgi:hypothetical protein